jgi:hypothetical protein
MKTVTQDFTPCVPGAFDGGLSRTAYYDGMVLAADDLLREQKYWRIKRKLTNRALGNGIVWGLGLDWDPKLSRFTVCPGYGLSCCGDDLIVECPEFVTERQLIDPCSEAFRSLVSKGLDPCCDDRRPDAPVEAALLLEYVECPEDPRRVYEDPCAQAPKGCRYGAVRETVRLTLIPPPHKPDCGPIPGFLKTLAEVRAELEKTGVAMPDPMATPVDPSTEISLTAIAVDGATTEGDTSKLKVKQGESIKLGAGTSASAARLRVGITPPPGYFCAKATFKGVDAPVVDSLMGWSGEIDLTAAGANDRTAVLDFLPFIGGGTSYHVLYSFTPGATGTPELTVAATEVETRDAPEDCASLLRKGILCSGDAVGTLRTLALATLYGWVAGALAPATCRGSLQPGEAPAEPDPIRVSLAWTICWMAWKSLFGIDMDDARARGLQACLRRLFADWCDGFHYKGPHCCENAHGIILGSVQVSPKGKILCFDEWAYRRHVLTGPLLTHWGSQFGLAPLDVVAGRFASWICCVAGVRLPERATDQSTTNGVAVPVGAAMLSVGQQLPEGTVVNGMTISARREVGTADFMQNMARAFSQDKAVEGASEAMVIASKQLDMALVVPVASRQIASVEAQNGVDAELAALKAAMPAMARQPMVDYVARLADELPLTALKPATDSPLFAPMVAALNRAEINSVGELIAAGPEAAVAKARADLVDLPAFADPPSVDRAMALVYDRATRTLASAGKVIADEARARTPDEAFTRAELPDVASKVQQALKPLLKQGQPASLAMLRTVAARAVTSAPG